jgi:hypothetical protein
MMRLIGDGRPSDWIIHHTIAIIITPIRIVSIIIEQ